MVVGYRGQGLDSDDKSRYSENNDNKAINKNMFGL